MQLIGCDVFIYAPGQQMPEVPKSSGPLRLELVANRGTKLWPTSAARLDYFAEEWRFRFTTEANQAVKHQDINTLLQTLTESGKTWTRVQALWAQEDGSRGFSAPY